MSGSRRGLPAAVSPVHLVLGLVLLAAAAAVLLLGREDPAPPPPAATAVTSAPTPVPTPATLTEARTGPRTAPVLGRTGNPFRPAKGAAERAERSTQERTQKQRAKAGGDATKGLASSGGGSGGSTSGGGSTSSGGGSTTSGGGSTTSGGGSGPARQPASTPTPAPAAPAPTPTPGTLVAYQPVVRLATRSGGSTSWPIARLQPLPGAGTPVAVFVGMRPGHQAGVFVVAPGVAVGGGRCAPARDRCKRLELGKGDTAVLTRDGVRFRLGLPDVQRQRVTPERERQLRRQVSGDDGRAALRSLVSQLGELRYDAARGVVVGG